jgi:hypothetical protein
MQMQYLAVVLVLLLLVGIPSARVNAQEILEHSMCNGVDPDTLKPRGLSNVFFTHSISAYYWFNASNFNGGEVIRVDWYNPDDYLYWSESFNVENPSNTVYWSKIDIEDHFPATDPGLWTVTLYIDNVVVEWLRFEIINYGLLAQKIRDLVSEINRFSNDLSLLTQAYSILQDNYTKTILELNTVKLNYNLLQLDHNTLQAEYELLSDSYKELGNTYVNLTVAYEDFFETYNSVQESYLNTQTALRATQTRFYVTLVTTGVFFITTVYFAIMGRRRPHLRVEEEIARDEELFTKKELERMLKAELKEILDVWEIKYRSRARKSELIDLILETQRKFEK